MREIEMHRHASTHHKYMFIIYLNATYMLPNMMSAKRKVPTMACRKGRVACHWEACHIEMLQPAMSSARASPLAHMTRHANMVMRAPAKVFAMPTLFVAASRAPPEAAAAAVAHSAPNAQPSARACLTMSPPPFINGTRLNMCMPPLRVL